MYVYICLHVHITITENALNIINSACFYLVFSLKTISFCHFKVQDKHNTYTLQQNIKFICTRHETARNA